MLFVHQGDFMFIVSSILMPFKDLYEETRKVMMPSQMLILFFNVEIKVKRHLFQLGRYKHF